MTTIRVIRPFTFSYPLGEGQKVHTEKFFPVGDHDVDDVIANHPWIVKHFADGCIETPEQARKRAAEASAIASRAEEDARYWTAHAEAAVKRAEAMAPQNAGDAKALEAELNTPINQLGVRQGAGISSSTPAGTPTAADEAAKAAAEKAAADVAAKAAAEKAAAEAAAAAKGADDSKKKSK